MLEGVAKVTVGVERVEGAQLSKLEEQHCLGPQCNGNHRYDVRMFTSAEDLHLCKGKGNIALKHMYKYRIAGNFHFKFIFLVLFLF